MRKGIISAILATVMVLSLAGCGSTVEPQQGSQTAETSQTMENPFSTQDKINYQKDLKALGCL